MYTDALERKLQPIYDAIDSRSYKNALKHTDAALKKHPGNQLLSSLRAFALQRTGKSEEALATLQSIVDKGPESERVLHTMTFTYRAAGKPEAIAPAYAVAAEKHPQDLEILKGLFGAYAKELNFVKQQQIALKLTKTHPEEADTYSWWAIVSLTLQARAAVLTTPPGSNAEQLMKLAETMIARQITKSKGTLPSYEALLLYTDVLQGQGKAHEAATIIKEASGTTAGGLKDDSRQLLAAALVRSGDVSAAAELFKEACLENTDDWWSWHLYLNCILPGSAKHSTKDLNTPVIAFPVGIVGGLAENWDSKHLEAVWETAAAAAEGGASIESAVQKAQKALEELKSTAEKASTTQSRGAVLAPLELACRLHRLGLYTGRQLAEAIVAALPSLCHSFSCAVDLRRYTSHLDSSEDRTWLAEQVLTICEEKAKLFEEENSNKDGTNKNSKAAIKALWCRTNAHALQQELGCISTTTTNTSTATSSAAVEYAVQMADLFASNLSLSQNLDPKDRGHGEDLVALAASSLVSAAINSSKNENTTSVLLLVTAILALEAAQVRRTVAAPLRLSACALYALLNAPKKSTAQLTALDVKSILHESLTGHWALPTLLASASPEADFDTWLSGITNLHVDQILEASESIFTAYEQGTYSKVPEFVDFWETLGASHTRWSGAAEGNILKLKSGTSPSGGSSGNALALASIAKGIVETDSNSLSPRPQIDTIRFNEDLSTRPAWFPPAAVDTRLAIASWWAGSSGSTMAHALPASSEMWWGVTGAAERRVPQAEQWRKAQRHGLARRQALPELLSGLLQPALLKNEKLASLSEVLNTAWVTKSYPETSSTVLTSPLEVSKTLFSAGVSLHQAINAANNSSTEDVAVAEAVCEKSCSAVDQFSQQFSTSLKEICELLRNEDGKVSLLPFPGNAAPAVLAAMLSEEALWAAACLPTWAKLIKSSFIAANAAQNQHLKERLQNAVHSAGNAVYSALLSLKEQLSATASATASPAAAADEILSQIGSLWPQASKLWSYESDFDAKKALGEVVAEQQAVMKRMLQLATQATTSLKQFA